MLTWENKEDIRNTIMKLGSENAYKVEGLLARIKYLEDSDDISPWELSKARYDFLRILEDMVKEDRLIFKKEINDSMQMLFPKRIFIDGRSLFERGELLRRGTKTIE